MKRSISVKKLIIIKLLKEIYLSIKNKQIKLIKIIIEYIRKKFNKLIK
jgi:hypothetical protein